jgi:hypothetical protein
MVLLAFLGALVGAVGVGVAVWLAELAYSPGANARCAIDQRHVERITAINRQFDIIGRVMGWIVGRRSTDQEIDAILTRAEKVAGKVGRLQERIRQLESANRRLRRLNQMRRLARLIHNPAESCEVLSRLRRANRQLRPQLPVAQF